MKRRLKVFPLIFSFVAWVLTICGLLGGRSGMYGNHVVSVNTSHFGRDLVNNSNLFNFDNTSIIYTLLFTENDTVHPEDNVVVVQPAVPARNKVLEARQINQDTRTTLISIVLPIYDFIADELRLNRTGFVYQTGYSILTTTSDKLGGETDRFLTRVKVIVPSAAISALQAQLLKLAQSYQIPNSDLATRSKMLTTDQWEAEQPWAVPETRNYNLNSQQAIHKAQVEHVRTTLLENLSKADPPRPNATLAQAIASGDFKSFLDSTLRGAATDLNGTLNALAAELDNPNSQNMPARLLHESRPYLATAIRQFVNTQLNTGVGYAKLGFKVHDFYSIYMTQFCYGDEMPNGKRHVVACQNINDLRDANLAHRIRRTLRAAGSYRRVPEEMKLGDGVESSIDGLSKITKLLYAIYLMGVITSGAAFWSTVISLVVPHRLDNFMDNTTMLMHLFAYTTLVIVFSLSLLLVLACKLVIGGVLSVISSINVAGWGFAVINILAILSITISFDFWIYIWMRNLRARAVRDDREHKGRPRMAEEDGRGSPEETSSEKGLVNHNNEGSSSRA